jgi:purine-nucleoside phosphorylase
MRLTEVHLEQSLDYLQKRTPRQPQVALILGSGLGEFADTIEQREVVPAADIPHYPRSTVPGHRGALVFGEIGQIGILAFQGRVHLYETGSAESVTCPVRLAHALGARTLIVTNAAGGINRRFEPGDLMLIADQVSFTASERSMNVPRTQGGLRPYSPHLIEIALSVAGRLAIPVHTGVYAGVRGPSYETAAEVAMLDRIGADAVGMSTVPEVETAANLGMQVLGISCITNKATGIGTAKLSHDDVTVVASKVKADFTKLLTGIIRSL